MQAPFARKTTGEIAEECSLRSRNSEEEQSHLPEALDEIVKRGSFGCTRGKLHECCIVEAGGKRNNALPEGILQP